jgi:hypothetical protein
VAGHQGERQVTRGEGCGAGLNGTTQQGRAKWHNVARRSREAVAQHSQEDYLGLIVRVKSSCCGVYGEGGGGGFWGGGASGGEGGARRRGGPAREGGAAKQGRHVAFHQGEQQLGRGGGGGRHHSNAFKHVADHQGEQLSWRLQGRERRQHTTAG